MNYDHIDKIFKREFDLVGVIDSQDFFNAQEQLTPNIIRHPFPTMVVLGLAYPKRTIKHTKTHLVPSFYTFGKDYHLVIKEKINLLKDDLPCAYELFVDNHSYNERLAAQLAGIGYFAKNQLIINESYGSYIFLSIVFLDISIQKPFLNMIEDGCKDCRKCIDACPTSALSEGHYIQEKCISHYNQSKVILTDDQIKHNYSLFGCDICQLACPKNINIQTPTNDAFKLSGKETVEIKDLFNLSGKEFSQKYNEMAYLWKGKTILMRNAVCLMYRHQNHHYLNEIKMSLEKYQMPWYQETVSYLYRLMKENGPQ